MAGLTRTVHVQWGVRLGPVEQIAPGVRVGPSANGDEPPEMLALAFTDENETHTYLMTLEQKQALIGMLSGGIEIAQTVPKPPAPDDPMKGVT